MAGTMYDVIIVGCGSSGLAVAKALQFKSLKVIIVEAGPCAGHSWRCRYQFTTMTSPKGKTHSAGHWLTDSEDYLELPGQKLRGDLPSFPTFGQYAEYLQDYAQNFRVLYNTPVQSASFDATTQTWVVNTAVTSEPYGSTSMYARHLVVASGWYSPDHSASSAFPGLDPATFNRPVYDADNMPDPVELTGQTVMVIGMGNTGGDIGMALVRNGVHVVYAIRSIPTISSVVVLGTRLHDVAKFILDRLPSQVKDFACAVAMWHAVSYCKKDPIDDQFRGPFERHFPASLHGTRWRPTRAGRLPTLNFGGHASLASAIKDKRVEIIRGPRSFGPDGLVYGFDEGVSRQVHAVVIATGFSPVAPSWLDGSNQNGKLHSVGQRGVVSIQEAARVATAIAGNVPRKPLFSACLLAIFCAANFIEILSGSAAVPALGIIAKDLDIDASESQWVLSAYNLTFAAFMLFSGRLSDVFSAKYVFLVGFSVAGVFALGAGFCASAIPLYCTRALQGIGASMAIPSAIRLICDHFRDDVGQGLALQLFAAAGAISNIIGFLVGGALADNGSWKWTMWIIAATSLPIAMIGLFIIPNDLSRPDEQIRSRPIKQKLGTVDILGSLLFALALFLFVYALTAGNTTGWNTARVIAPLLTCIVVVLPFFFIYEEYGRTRRGHEAALPLFLWKLPNFALLFLVSVTAFYFYGCLFITLSTLWSGPAYELSPYTQAKHFLPAGIATLLIAVISPPLIDAVGIRIFLSAAMLVYAASGVLLARSNGMDSYWNRDLPGMVLGAFGAGAAYICCSKALVQAGPPTMSGVLGATFNSALQTGYVLAIGVSLALIEQIGAANYVTGYSAAFYSVTAIGGIAALLCAVFARQPVVGNAGGESSTEIPSKPEQEKLPLTPSSEQQLDLLERVTILV